LNGAAIRIKDAEPGGVPGSSTPRFHCGWMVHHALSGRRAAKLLGYVEHYRSELRTFLQQHQLPEDAIKGCLPTRLTALTTESAAVSATTAVSAATATLALGTGFIDVQCAAFEIRAVQTGDSPVGFLGVAHFDKRKAAGAAGITIRNQIDTINCSIPLEHGPNRRIGGGKIQIAYKNILHSLLFLSFNCAGKTRQIRTAQLRRDSQKAS
jgi:hypothetical protein